MTKRKPYVPTSAHAIVDVLEQQGALVTPSIIRHLAHISASTVDTTLHRLARGGVLARTTVRDTTDCRRLVTRWSLVGTLKGRRRRELITSPLPPLDVPHVPWVHPIKAGTARPHVATLELPMDYANPRRRANGAA